jgi:hypothetical protein
MQPEPLTEPTPEILPPSKHGLYTITFHDLEITRLEKDFQGRLEDEMAMMRIFLLYTAMHFKDIDDMTHEEVLGFLRGITHAIGRVESIVSTQKVVFDDGGETIEKALESLQYIPFDQD